MFSIFAFSKAADKSAFVLKVMRVGLFSSLVDEVSAGADEVVLFFDESQDEKKSVEIKMTNI